jgi:hypothetical protein
MKAKKVEAFECTNCGKVHKDEHEAQKGGHEPGESKGSPGRLRLRGREGP